MNKVEMDAADALLDRRLRVTIPAPWVFRVLGKATVDLWVRRPVGSNLFRMARLFCEMDIDLKKLRSGEFGTLLGYVGKHGVTASRMIAYGLIRGNWAAWWLNRPLAWYIRSHMDMRGMAELTKLVAVLSGAEDFASTIASASGLRLTESRASQSVETGS